MLEEPKSTDSAERISYLEKEIEHLSLELGVARQQASGGTNSWQGPFSDMITLLLCFFIVMTAVMAVKQGNPFATSAVITSMQEQGIVPNDIKARQEFLRNLEKLGESDRNITVYKQTDKIRIIISSSNFEALSLDADNENQIKLFDDGNAHLTEIAERLLLKIATQLVVPPKDTVDSVNTFIQILDQTFQQIRIEAHTSGEKLNEVQTEYFRTKWDTTFYRAYNTRNYFARIENFPPELIDKTIVVACADKWPEFSEDDDFLFSLSPDWADRLERIYQSPKVDGRKDKLALSDIFFTELRSDYIVEEIEKLSRFKYYFQREHDKKYSILDRESGWQITGKNNPEIYLVRLEKSEQLSISVMDNGTEDPFQFSIDPNTNDFFYQIQYLVNTPSRKARNQREKLAQSNRNKYIKNIKYAFSQRQVQLSDSIEITNQGKNVWHLNDNANDKTYHIRKGRLNFYRKRMENSLTDSSARKLARRKNDRIEIHLIING